MKTILLIFAAARIASAYEFPMAPGEAEEIEKGLQQWRDIAANQGNISDEEYIKKLGRGLRKTSKPMPYRRGDREGTHAIIRDKLLSIPGHAEFFGERINQTYGKVKEGYAEGKKAGEIPAWNWYLDESLHGFQTLALLPSPETVRVLGEMLSDDWTWPGIGIHNTDAIQESLDARAMFCLTNLPIANPPTGQILGVNERRARVHLWKQWYAEIESGRRTFRFIGDDTEYDLRGPVRREGSVERNRGQKRPLSEGEPESQAVGRENKPFRFLPYAIAFLFLAGGIWSLIRKNKRNPNAVSR